MISPQRELLLWHWKLGINMYRVQELMLETMFEEPLGKCTVFPSIIKPKFPSARNCVIPVSVLPPCLCQEEDSQHEAQYGYP